MANLTVELAERSYPIHIIDNALNTVKSYLAHLNQQIFVVTNPTVAEHYLDLLLNQLSPHQVDVFIMPDGEQYKSLATYTTAMDQLVGNGFNRDCAVVALGGGVVGDLAGFIAATYQRGVDFYQIPTTLLAQVDSSVGGKTAVNHPQGKNLIGAFYQPRAVLIDPKTLQTLTERDYRSGLAEVIKYGIIYDADFFRWLEAHTTALKQRDTAVLTEAITRSCRIKAAIVSSDERETGIRAILNLGHTFGHAIEAASQYGEWTHGEAVAAGTIIASKLSEVTQRLSSSDFCRIESLLKQLGLPIQAPQLPLQVWLDFMQRDKKVKDGTLHFILPKGIGAAEVVSGVNTQTIATVLTECC